MKLRVFFISLLLFGPMAPSISATPPKSGSTCAKTGLTQNYKGKKYTCVKSGKKLLWDSGVIIKQAAPQPSPSKTTIPAPVPSSSIKPLPSSSPSSSTNPSTSPVPTQSSTPSPSSSSIEDTGKIPDFTDVTVSSTGETTADFSFKATNYLSYRYFVVLLSDLNGKEVQSSSIINGNADSQIIKIINLECSRINYYEVRVTVYSGINGKGNPRTGGAKIPSTGTCATPRPKFTDSYVEPSRSSRSLDTCKIQEASAIRKTVGAFSSGTAKLEAISGFPLTQSRLPAKGTMRMIAIPVDWSDLPGESNFLETWRNQFNIFTEWVELASQGNLKVDVSIHDKWIRLSGRSTSYAVPFSEAYPQSGDFWRKAIPTVDPLIDFTSYQVAVFILPAGQTVVRESVQELYPYGAIKDSPPKEGNLIGFIGAGSYFENWNVSRWSYLPHELGHLIDFAHGGSGRDSGEMGGYDIMFSQDGPFRTFSGWWRFLADWFKEDQVFCDVVENFKDLNISLVPLDSKQSGIKLAMIKISPTKILILESRRFSKFDNLKRQAFFQKERDPEFWDGLFVYTYDASQGHLQNFLTPIASNLALAEYNWDGRTRYISYASEVTEHAGLKITLNQSGNYDSVNIRLMEVSELAQPRPTPSPAPSPVVEDFDIEPFVVGGAIRTSETTGVSTWYGQNFRSYRIYVVPLSNPGATPFFDSGIVNDYRSPIKVTLKNLVCNRDLVEIAIFYSGLSGKGKSIRVEQSAALSAVNIDDKGNCQGYWTNGAVGLG